MILNLPKIIIHFGKLNMHNFIKKSYIEYNEKIFTDNLYSFDIKRQYRYHPSLTFILEKYGKHYDDNDLLFINSVGLRAPETYDKDKYRVCLIGGSVAFGSYAPKNGSTISSFIEKILKKKNINDIQVFNCGYGGHLSYQHLISLTNIIIPKYKPHLVICLSGFNDFKAALRNLKKGYPLQDEFTNLINTIQTGTFIKIFKNVYLKTLIVRYYFFKKIYVFFYKFMKKESSLTTVENNHVEDYSKYYSNNILDMISICNSKQISFIHYMQPCIGIGNKVLTKFEENIYKDCIDNFPEYSKILHKFYKKCYDEISKYFNKKNIEYKNTLLHINGKSVFDNNKDQIYVDPAHIGDKGNFIIAKGLADKIYKFYKNKKC